MEAKSVVLKLYLDALGVSEEIQNVSDRKRVQKAIYIGQRAGVNLGYRFGWYLMGPYSTDLTRDYYTLAEAISDGETDFERQHLLSPAKETLEAIQGLMTPPSDVSLDQSEWLELLASLDYVRKVQGLNNDDARVRLTDEKPGLVDYFDRADQLLEQFGLAE